MQRLAFKMKLNEGQVAEYKHRHDALWEELRDLLKTAGIHNYSIFFDEETHLLFAFQEVENSEGSQALGEEAIVQKWWAYMADIMETNADHSPVSTPLIEVFHLD